MPTISSSKTYSVSEITGSIKQTLESSAVLRYVRVEGEIAEIKRTQGKFGSDYLYFTLKDASAQLPAVMFSGVNALPFAPKKGDSVVCEGKITVYAPYGKYQLQCSAMFESGEGAAERSLKELKERLQAEGLFDQHRELPKFPRRIAVITSATGAVKEDIRSTLEDRCPVEMYMIPASVQGENAVPTLIAGINRAQSLGVDVIIFGRGGGSTEDLDCFNSEALARAIYASKIPTISAVGHQIDFTVADLVADVRASTPTKAAVLVVPEKEAVLKSIAAERELAKSLMTRALSNTELRLAVLDKEVRLYSPRGRINVWEQTLLREKTAVSTEIRYRLDAAERAEAKASAEIRDDIHRKLERAEAGLGAAAQSISDLNPMGVLARGYSLTKSGGKVITDAKSLKKGDTVDVKLERGAFSASVIDISEA